MWSRVYRGVQYGVKFTSIDSAVKKHEDIGYFTTWNDKTFQRRAFARNVETCFIVSGGEGTYVVRVHIEH